MTFDMNVTAWMKRNYFCILFNFCNAWKLNYRDYYLHIYKTCATYWNNRLTWHYQCFRCITMIFPLKNITLHLYFVILFYNKIKQCRHNFRPSLDDFLFLVFCVRQQWWRLSRVCVAYKWNENKSSQIKNFFFVRQFKQTHGKHKSVTQWNRIKENFV